ncbi:hypothetical protein [Streptomyces sedi]|uniref:hypothetical protein n=1 Tax=Streptomyces sedi TaxID=555059 RepID=UPI001477674D|nr:hypothetical protein [Streptomyces sedi]
MTVPEENRPKTTTTDPELTDPAPEQGDPRETGDGTGRTLREALEEADVTPDDYEE